VHLTAGRNVDASVSLGTEGLIRRAELDANSAVLVENVVIFAIATLVERSQIVRLIVMITSFNDRKTLLVVVGGSVSGSAE